MIYITFAVFVLACLTEVILYVDRYITPIQKEPPEAQTGAKRLEVAMVTSTAALVINTILILIKG